MSMWKQLFAEAPPGAMEKLLSPKRKLFYALFALTPGTVLGLYLQSVKNDMERENETLRLQHVADELQGEVEREQKDALLMTMIHDLRSRIQSLESEVTAAQRALSTATTSTNSSSTEVVTVPTQAPAATAEWEQQRDAFLRPSTSSSSLSSSTTSGGGPDAKSGISARVQQRERDALRDDVRAFKAARAAATTASDAAT